MKNVFFPFLFILMTIKHIVFITNNAKKIIFATVVWNIYRVQHLHFYITIRLRTLHEQESGFPKHQHD